MKNSENGTFVDNNIYAIHRIKFLRIMFESVKDPLHIYMYVDKILEPVFGNM